MGYQQKLLYISGVVAVGIAILMGIEKFRISYSEANLNALTLDLLAIATRAQQYYFKPRSMDGGSMSFDRITADSRGMIKLSTSSQNLNGSFQILESESQCLTLQAIGNEDFDGDGRNLTIQMKVFPDNIQTTVISY